MQPTCCSRYGSIPVRAANATSARWMSSAVADSSTAPPARLSTYTKTFPTSAPRRPQRRQIGRAPRWFCRDTTPAAGRPDGKRRQPQGHRAPAAPAPAPSQCPRRTLEAPRRMARPLSRAAACPIGAGRPQANVEEPSPLVLAPVHAHLASVAAGHRGQALSVLKRRLGRPAPSAGEGSGLGNEGPSVCLLSRRSALVGAAGFHLFQDANPLAQVPPHRPRKSDEVPQFRIRQRRLIRRW